MESVLVMSTDCTVDSRPLTVVVAVVVAARCAERQPDSYACPALPVIVVIIIINIIINNISTVPFPSPSAAARKHCTEITKKVTTPDAISELEMLQNAFEDGLALDPTVGAFRPTDPLL